MRPLEHIWPAEPRIRYTAGVSMNEAVTEMRNSLFKMARVRKAQGEGDLAVEMQPEDTASDIRLINDSFRRSVRNVFRRLAFYIDTDGVASEGDIVEVSPEYVRLSKQAGSTAVVTITSSGSWVYDIEGEGTPEEVESEGFYGRNVVLAVHLKFPVSWKNTGNIDTAIKDYVVKDMESRWLEYTDVKTAARLREEADVMLDELRSMCDMRDGEARHYNPRPLW